MKKNILILSCVFLILTGCGKNIIVPYDDGKYNSYDDYLKNEGACSKDLNPQEHQDVSYVESANYNEDYKLYYAGCVRADTKEFVDSSYSLINKDGSALSKGSEDVLESDLWTLNNYIATNGKFPPKGIIDFVELDYDLANQLWEKSNIPSGYKKYDLIADKIDIANENAK